MPLINLHFPGVLSLTRTLALSLSPALCVCILILKQSRQTATKTQMKIHLKFGKFFCLTIIFIDWQTLALSLSHSLPSIFQPYTLSLPLAHIFIHALQILLTIYHNIYIYIFSFLCSSTTTTNRNIFPNPTQQCGRQTCHNACHIACTGRIHIDVNVHRRHESKVKEIRTQQIERHLKKGICCLALRQGQEHADEAQLAEAMGQESFQVHATRRRGAEHGRVQSAGHQRLQFTEQFHGESRIESRQPLHLARARSRSRRRVAGWHQQRREQQVEAFASSARH